MTGRQYNGCLPIKQPGRRKSKRAQPDPPITETAIKRQTDAKVFERGEDCFASGMIVGAVLLTHVRAPEKIITKAAVKAALADRKRDDLIALIAQMIDYEPDFYGLIDGSGLPEPGEFDDYDEAW